MEPSRFNHSNSALQLLGTRQAPAAKMPGMATMTLAEAAAHLLVSTDTIRRRLQRGALLGHKEAGVWFIELPEQGNGQADAPQLPCNCQAEITRLEEMISTVQAQLEVKDRQIGELHVLLQTSQAALPPPRAGAWWRFW